jgi:hypothetical protein
LGEIGEDSTREKMNCFGNDLSYKLEVIVHTRDTSRNLLKTSLDKKRNNQDLRIFLRRKKHEFLVNVFRK